MDTVTLADRSVRRLGVSAAVLRTTGMWGEPADRGAAIETLRRAVQLGADVVEVPFPFGPAADLVREAGVAGAFLVVRLTTPVASLDMVTARLGGRRPDLVLAEPDPAAAIQSWPVPLGVVLRHEAVPPPGAEAVLGPFPPPPRLLEACEAADIPYLAPALEILGAGRLTIALPAPRSVAEVERVFGGAATPPAAGPG
jgi:hypothetical protein